MVSFYILPIDLALWNENMQFVTEPGEFELMVAKSAADVKFRKVIKYIDE